MFSNLRVEGGRSNHWVAPLRLEPRPISSLCCDLSRGPLTSALRCGSPFWLCCDPSRGPLGPQPISRAAVAFDAALCCVAAARAAATRVGRVARRAGGVRRAARDTRARHRPPCARRPAGKTLTEPYPTTCKSDPHPVVCSASPDPNPDPLPNPDPKCLVPTAPLSCLQVNLAPLLPPRVLRAFDAANVSAQFHITPPAWGRPPTEPFAPYAVPLVEVRRRLAAAAQQGRDVYLRYRVVSVSTAGGGDSSGGSGGGGGDGVGGVRVYRRKRGVLSRGSDAWLHEPLPPLRALLHRFRTFDLAESPCRH
eukprot:1776-Prymnesium_polylepis.1